jgi:hypothetical protein
MPHSSKSAARSKFPYKFTWALKLKGVPAITYCSERVRVSRGVHLPGSNTNPILPQDSGFLPLLGRLTRLQELHISYWECNTFDTSSLDHLTHLRDLKAPPSCTFALLQACHACQGWWHPRFDPLIVCVVCRWTEPWSCQSSEDDELKFCHGVAASFSGLAQHGSSVGEIGYCYRFPPAGGYLTNLACLGRHRYHARQTRALCRSI